MKVEINAGKWDKMKGKHVTFCRSVRVELWKNKDGTPFFIAIPKGTVGVLTGGFINKRCGKEKHSKRLISRFDVDVCLFRGIARIFLTASVPLGAFESIDTNIN